MGDTRIVVDKRPYGQGEVEVAIEEGLSIVRLLGEHDLNTTQLIADTLAALIETGSPLVFDLSETTFIDSGVTRIFDATRIAAVPVALVVPEPSSPILRRALEMTGVAKRIPVVPSWRDARQVLAAGASPD
jgi:anti-sigma B factor antagonist